jgi:hypothetical protein
MYKTISNEIIRKFHIGYDPSKYIKNDNEELPVREWVEKYRNVVPIKDIIWLLLRNEFMSEKDLRLFAVWCAREALKLVENPDERSVNACNVAEKFANGEATKKELDAAHIAALNAAYDDAYDATSYVAHDATYAASDATYDTASDAAFHASYDAYDAAYDAALDAALDADDVANAFRDAQLDKLLTYFE